MGRTVYYIIFSRQHLVKTFKIACIRGIYFETDKKNEFKRISDL